MKKLQLPMLAILLSALPLAAQAPAAADMNTQLRAQESADNSKVMWILHNFTDVYGPRLTGTPRLKNADDWAVKTMQSWGMQAHVEGYPFIPETFKTTVPGWDNLELIAEAVEPGSPFHGQLMVKPLHWTPSTKGTVTAEAVLITPPGLTLTRGRGATPTPMPTQADLDAWFAQTAPKIKNKIVLVGNPRIVPVNFNPAPLRRSDQQWEQIFDPNNSGSGGRGNFGGGGRRGNTPDPTRLTRQQINTQLDAFLIKNNVGVRINDAGMDHGVIVAYNNPTYDITKEVPTVVMRNDDYGRIARVLADDTTVTLRFRIDNVIYPEGKTSYNAIGEIPGTDKKDEVVMMGGHLDSWQNATGATDNAIGCSMMMEAARILLALHVQPRRTIRVALWSGEEEGLVGSLAYVDQHFGSYEHPKPEFDKLDAYFNIDDGTSKPRGASVFGPASAAAMIRENMASFRDWGFMGAAISRSRAVGDTDSFSFNHSGLPGINLEQDPIEYGPVSWHSNLDTYERIVPEDVREGAAEVASIVYTLAMSDQMLPRYSAAEMPPPIQPRGAAAAAPASTPAITPAAAAAKGSKSGGGGGR